MSKLRKRIASLNVISDIQELISDYVYEKVLKDVYNEPYFVDETYTKLKDQGLIEELNDTMLNTPDVIKKIIEFAEEEADKLD